MLKSLKLLSGASLLAFSAFSFAADSDVNADKNDVVISGYDTVAYFTDGKPKKGSKKYTATYKNAIYQFSSASNRDLFKSNPEKYAPQYGGFCAMGVALEQKLDVDPQAWKIVDGKLFLNLNKTVQKKWQQDLSGNLKQSEENWNEIRFSSSEYLADK